LSLVWACEAGSRRSALGSIRLDQKRPATRNPRRCEALLSQQTESASFFAGSSKLLLPCINHAPARNNQPCRYSVIWATMLSSSPLVLLFSAELPTPTTPNLHNPPSRPLCLANLSLRNRTPLPRSSVSRINNPSNSH